MGKVSTLLVYGQDGYVRRLSSLKLGKASIELPVLEPINKKLLKLLIKIIPLRDKNPRTLLVTMMRVLNQLIKRQGLPKLDIDVYRQDRKPSKTTL
jgi:hypothetical protein